MKFVSSVLLEPDSAVTLSTSLVVAVSWFS
jgi:hypothetical protein